jgi:hypothetical protein
LSTLNETDKLVPEQYEILFLLEKLWVKNPRMRLGQLVFNYAIFPNNQVLVTRDGAMKSYVGDYFHTQDEDVLAKLRGLVGDEGA